MHVLKYKLREERHLPAIPEYAAPGDGFCFNLGAFHEPMQVLVRTILPHPCPLPLGEGESSSDGLKRRTIIAVHGHNALPKKGLEPAEMPRRRR